MSIIIRELFVRYMSYNANYVTATSSVISFYLFVNSIRKSTLVRIHVKFVLSIFSPFRFLIKIWSYISFPTAKLEAQKMMILQIRSRIE